MNLSVLLPLLEGTPEFQAVVARLQGGTLQAESLETLEAARPYVLAALQRALARPLLVITARAERARQLLVELQAWSASPDKVSYFAEPDPLLYERVPWSTDSIASRLAAMMTLAQENNQNSIVVTTIRALLPYTVKPEEFRDGISVLKRGEHTGLEALVGKWVDLGY